MKVKKTLVQKYRLIQRLEINKNNRRNLKNHDFSIICSNCLGGVIYHDLGLKFMSPTINVFLYPKDYLKFIYDLDYYLHGARMIEDEFESKKRGYPVGLLDDIRLYFGHDSNFLLAKNKWFERCKRVNFNNLFFMMIQRDGCTENDLFKFDHFHSSHKVVFTTRERPDIKSAYHIPGAIEQNEVMTLIDYKNRKTGLRWIDDFDYISFFNQNH